MNPIQQVGGNAGTQFFYANWMFTDILAGLLYRRISELKTDATDLSNILVPTEEFHVYVANASAIAGYAVNLALSQDPAVSSGGGTQGGATRRSA